ncbi:MAG: hypothetical protein COV44_01540 [Deltaproteobacteria bacterium CG11_big_fil_rev_8_21_14_0_20_45_16]|nr:MAG: hypothetical protein COV44_01540 [Deltaproteobacteria bacterium CG11_big_fil_rev_8_21_14_0_20_45_16]
MDRTPSFHVQAFGAYFLLDRIAVGGMAEIFKAKQVGVRGFEKIIVIKKILQHLGEDKEFVEMFEDEAKIAAQLNHTNIVQIYELGEIDDTLYIIMEYVEGRNLRDVTRSISAKGLHLSLPQSLFIITEVLKGLDYAHRKKDSQGQDLTIIHRDMSPQNIIISYEGEVKILDFGIAKAASKASKTEAGVLKGKFSYMSPEQAGGREIDQTTDIYACGVIFHELITSERLFRAETDLETLERVKQGNAPAPSDKNPELPKELDKIVLKALHRSPEKRYASASEFLNEITKFSFERGLTLSSQELSAFMNTLFAESIQLERERLQRSLAQVPSADELKAPKNVRTHIAFKAPQFEQLKPTPTDFRDEERTQPTFKGRTKSGRFRWIASFLFIGALIAYLWTNSPSKVRPPASRLPEPPAQRTPEVLPAEPTPSLPEQPPPKDPAQDIENVLKIDETPDRTPKVQIEPKAKPKPKPPKPKLRFGSFDVIAPPEGYAKLTINNKDFGTVPGPSARGIRLPVGRHLVRCETSTRTYEGNFDITGESNQTLRCADLNK